MEWIAYGETIAGLKKLQECGITTVLVGEKKTSSRIVRRFNWEEIEEFYLACQGLGLKLGLVMNRIFFDSDLADVQAVLQKAQRIDLERIEYTDPAVFIEAEKLGLKEKLIYNPDTLMTSWQDIAFYQALGIGGVVLSKEITLDEMKEIAGKIDGHLEAAVFGRLNMSYSRRPLISNYLHQIQRSEMVKERRDFYLIEETRDGRMPIVEDEYGTAVYTDYTLGAFHELKELAESGIEYFRFDSQFIEEEVFLDCLKGFQAVLNGAEGKKILEQLQRQYPKLALDSGYMYRKTNLVK